MSAERRPDTRPLFRVLLCGCCGICAGKALCQWFIPWYWCAWVSLALLAWLGPRVPRVWPVMAMCVWVCQGASWISVSMLPLRNDVRETISRERGEFSMRARVERTRRDATGTHILASVEEVSQGQWRLRSRGEVRLDVLGICEARSGDRVIFIAALGFSRDKMAVVAKVKPWEVSVQRIPLRWWEFRAWAGRMNQACGEVISQYLPSLHAAVAEAMVFGRQEHVPRSVSAMMVRTGTIHILVVSGFNVGVVAGCALALCAVCGISRGTRIALCVCLVCAYCLLAGADTPVCRAAVMATAGLLAVCARRETDIYNTLGLAGLVVIGVDPGQVFDAGAQLSFASVGALAGIYPLMRKAARIDSWKVKLCKAVGEGALSSCAAWLGTAGIIAWRFRMVSPVTVAVNIVALPLATLVTVSGFCLLCCGLWVPLLAGPVAAACQYCIAGMLWVVSAMDHIPGAYFYL